MQLGVDGTRRGERGSKGRGKGGLVFDLSLLGGGSNGGREWRGRPYRGQLKDQRVKKRSGASS